MATFEVTHMAKTHNSWMRSPNMSKYFVTHCRGRITDKTPTTESWLHVLRFLQFPISEYDKSRVLLGVLDQYGKVVVKIGSTSDIQNEFTISNSLRNSKGFVKYICSFACEDDFRTVREHTSLCKGPGDSMNVIVMPYFPLGSLALYKWNTDSIHLLHSCLKHSFLSVVSEFHTSGFIHGDFHAGNVLIKQTKHKSLSYSIHGIGVFQDIPTYGIRTWIMDYEKSKFVSPSNLYEEMVAWNDFSYDITKFFMFLKETISINLSTVQPISMYVGKLNISGKRMSYSDVGHILQLIEGIRLM